MVVGGIGIEAAFQIWFETWTVELTPSSTYADAATGSKQSCIDLGYTEDVCDQVHNAWYEVGVLSSAACAPGECGSQCGTCCNDNDCTVALACQVGICGTDGQCIVDSSGCNELFELTLQLDIYGSETSWELADNCNNGAVVLSGGPYSNTDSLIEFSQEIGEGEFTLTIHDSYGKLIR